MMSSSRIGPKRTLTLEVDHIESVPNYEHAEESISTHSEKLQALLGAMRELHVSAEFNLTTQCARALEA
jgi:hypothetical protein